MFLDRRKIADRWVGTESISLHDGAITTLSYTLRVLEEEITEAQKAAVLDVLGKYEEFWSAIEPKSKKLFNVSLLSPRLLLYMPAVLDSTEYDFMLGYEFVGKNAMYSAFFAFNNGCLAYEHIDAH